MCLTSVCRLFQRIHALGVDLALWLQAQICNQLYYLLSFSCMLWVHSLIFMGFLFIYFTCMVMIFGAIILVKVSFGVTNILFLFFDLHYLFNRNLNIILINSFPRLAPNQLYHRTCSFSLWCQSSALVSNVVNIIN